MITPEIIAYVKLERSKNTSDSVIKSNLLANGWNESDIAEAMQSVSLSGVPKPSVNFVDLKKHRDKVLWTTFFVLLIVDVLIIAWFMLVQGTWGIFGISPASIVIRLLVIYLFSAFVARGSSTEEKTSKAVGKTILKILGTLFMFVGIAVGLFFAFCFFAASGVFR